MGPKNGSMLILWVQQVESKNSKESEQSKYDQLAFECSNGVLIHHPSVWLMVEEIVAIPWNVELVEDIIVDFCSLYVFKSFIQSNPSIVKDS